MVPTVPIARSIEHTFDQSAPVGAEAPADRGRQLAGEVTADVGQADVRPSHSGPSSGVPHEAHCSGTSRQSHGLGRDRRGRRRSRSWSSPDTGSTAVSTGEGEWVAPTDLAQHRQGSSRQARRMRGQSTSRASLAGATAAVELGRWRGVVLGGSFGRVSRTLGIGSVVQNPPLSSSQNSSTRSSAVARASVIQRGSPVS